MKKSCNCQNQPMDLETKIVLFEWMMDVSDDKKVPNKNKRINSILRSGLYSSVAEKLIKIHERKHE